MIRFGPWSTILGLAAGFGLLVALLLLLAPQNRSANRLLAALLLVVVLRLMPYVIGYAGFYDAYPWLSFAPFDLLFAIGPLLWLYVRRLTSPALPPGWGWHFVPAAVDLAYNLWAFALPLEAKFAWNDGVHRVWVGPLESVLGIASLAIYLGLAARYRAHYQRWLVAHASDRDAHRQPWIATVLAAIGLWLAVTIGFEIVDQFGVGLNYFDRFPQYLVFAAIVLGLGLEGWRHAAHRFPHMLSPVAETSTPVRDWRAQALDWSDRIREGGWWREPGLSLADVARRLGTNESYVSRACNDGLGQNFNAVINGFRVTAVQARLLDSGEDLLGLALDCGFSSKASFNRVFREIAGTSPSAWRAAQIAQKTPDPPFEATTAAGGS